MKKSALQDVVVDKRDQIEGLIKGLEVIRAFDHESVRLTPTELGEKVGLSRTAARRYLLTLVHVGMAATDGRTFWLRPRVLSIGHAYVDSARLPRLRVQNQPDSFKGCPPSKRWMASEQLVKHGAKSVDICRASDARVISHRLFRRHVAGSAQNFHRARDGTLCFDEPCQPEIGEMRFAFCVEQDVSGFDVSMEDAVLMRIVNCAGQLGDQFRCVTDRYRFALGDGIKLDALH